MYEATVMLDSKLQSTGSLGSKAKQIVANVAKYFLKILFMSTGLIFTSYNRDL